MAARVRVMAVTVVALVVSAIAASASSAAAAQGQSNEVWLIPIDGEITAATTSFVRSRIQRANDEGVLGVVLFLDTPGGSVDAMQDIVGIIHLVSENPSGS